ncbi:MAG: bifunctional glutamate N-acetyltransferase/amino-acid acetyltransferase ArgJ [Gammaproteobacteria bacterium]|nr:bifunctional glutamate N-acetyltransferase/amino-acid acetyltransferase ArgJ [Gammaproteobacteria bacterium]
MAASADGGLPPEPVRTVPGVRLSAVSANIRYRDRPDLVAMELAPGSETCAVFTRNAFCAAPVEIARAHLAAARPRYLLINAGNANAGTGAAGRRAALSCCEALARRCGVPAEQVLPFSTGVIGEALPVDRITDALPQLTARLDPGAWLEAAKAILTTDTRSKTAYAELNFGGKTVRIAGIAKGSGMIRPDMATMLAFVFTDAKLSRAQVDSLLREQVENSFNRITVDGDTSTNDACVLTATGAGAALGEQDGADWESFRSALAEVFRRLAQAIIRDAEGGSKFVTVRVSEGATSGECLQVAYAVAESPLVKTACFASDPNWGRILAAVGRAGIADLDLAGLRIYLGGAPVVADGEPHPDYSEEAGLAAMAGTDIDIDIRLGRGECRETVWTSDLSHDYVRINAEYRS